MRTKSVSHSEPAHVHRMSTKNSRVWEGREALKEKGSVEN